MKDFIEIMSFCGYDLDAANEIVKSMGPEVYKPDLADDLLVENINVGSVQ